MSKRDIQDKPIERLRELFPDEGWQYCRHQRVWWSASRIVREKRTRYVSEAGAWLVEFYDSDGTVIEAMGCRLERDKLKRGDYA